MATLRCYRMNPSDEEPEQLLSEEGQWTEPWGDSEDGSRCEKCDGIGELEHSCWSCLLTRARADCPVCGGKVRWDATCPVCRGIGETDGAPRHGVSVFPTLEGLYHYMEAKGAAIDDCLVVSLEGTKSADVDFDADQGAMLVIPTAITACERANLELAARVRQRTGAVRSD